MIRSEKRLRLCVTLLIMNLVFIWGNSLLPADMSRSLSDWVKALLSGLLPGGGAESGGSGLLRKIAHFAEFASLGVLLGWLFGMVGKREIYPFLCGFGAACVDECIQCFVPDRGPGLMDVGIDTCGVLVGIALIRFGYEFTKKMHIIGGK